MSQVITVIGHLTIDEIILNEESFENMGGVACYASIAASRLGASVKVISTIGEDFPEKYLKILSDLGIETSNVVRAAHSKTTRFRIKYLGDERSMWILGRAPQIPIKPVRGDAVYLGPVARELSVNEVGDLLRSHDKVLLDPQGLLRIFDKDGKVVLRRRELDLRGLWCMRTSIEEASIMTGEQTPKKILERLGELAEIVLLTAGSRGALISFGSKKFIVPTYPVKAVDSTGAGDVFGGAFLAEYLRTGKVDWASAVGSAMASIVVEDRGFRPLLSKDVKRETYRRADEIYERMREL